MQPDSRLSDVDLAVNRLATTVPRHASWSEAKYVDQIIVRGWDVIVDEKRNHALNLDHGVLTFHPARSVVLSARNFRRTRARFG